MSANAAAGDRRWRARAARASVVFIGAALLGPILPALVYTVAVALGAAFGAHLAGPQTQPASSVWTLFAQTIAFAFGGGGGLVALLSGSTMAGALLWRGRLSASLALRIVALAAVLVALDILRTPSTTAWLALMAVFVATALASTRLLYAFGVRLRVLP